MDQGVDAEGSQRKAVKLEAGASASQSRHRRSSSGQEDIVLGPTGDDRPLPAERNYTWQSGAPSYPPGMMSITSINSPKRGAVKDGGPAEGKVSASASSGVTSPSHQSQSRVYRGEGSRLPGIASLSSRPTSPPPQVARINAPRSFVSATPLGVHGGGMSGGPRLPFPASSSYGPVSPRANSSTMSQLAQHSAYGAGAQQAAHQSGGPPGTPPLSHQAAQGCPPIHPSLIGLPGSGTGPGNKQQPSFVAKLYSMLEDEATGSMISWGPSGDVFSVANPAEFSRVVLPTWFKHANWQSFVRQLNMYGFHKVNHTFSGAPNEEVQIWEFKHASFRRGDVHLLADIKRKSSRHKRTGSHSQSFGGSFHALDYDGRLRSRSSTPPEAYMGDMLMHPGAAAPSSTDNMLHDPRMRGYPHMDSEMRESMPGAHARVRSLTDAAMRPPPRTASSSAVEQPTLPRPLPGPISGTGAPLPSTYSTGSRLAGPSAPPPVDARGSHIRSASTTAASMPATSAGVMETSDPARVEYFQEMSDRMDAVIRHAGFLENQVKILSDQVAIESSARLHTTNVLGRLIEVCSMPPIEDASSEQMRRQVLDICHSQLVQLSSLPVREWSQSPSDDPRQWMEATPAPVARHRQPQHQQHRSEGNMRMLPSHAPLSPEYVHRRALGGPLRPPPTSATVARSPAGHPNVGPQSAYTFPPKRG
ncbi:unnamed protein product [Parajaminaea phylloscopi]